MSCSLPEPFHSPAGGLQATVAAGGGDDLPQDGGQLILQSFGTDTRIGHGALYVYRMKQVYSTRVG